MSLEKQLAVNRLKLPMDMVNIIKDFAFEEKVKWFIKQKKKEIVALFHEAIYSRKNTSLWVTETSEEWLFLMHPGEKQFQGCNCMSCGNFIVAMDPRVLCLCPLYNDDELEQEDEFDDAEPIDFQDFDDEPMWDYM